MKEEKRLFHWINRLLELVELGRNVVEIGRQVAELGRQVAELIYPLK